MKETITLVALALMAGVTLAQAQDASAGDPALGEKTARICKTCHQFGEGAKNSIGPVLNGVVGRKAGTYEGYSYSEANKGSGLTWDEATLKIYLKSPKALVPGTKMSFAGFQKESDINNVVAFLKTLGPDGKKQ